MFLKRFIQRKSVTGGGYGRKALLLLGVIAVCLLGRISGGVTPSMQVDGDQTVTGGLNVGDATDAATAQVKMKSSSSPSVAWQSTYQAGSAGPSPCSSAMGTGWMPSDEELGGLVDALAVCEEEEENKFYAYSQYESTNYLYAYSFGFSIPTNATITGVEVSYCVQGEDSSRWACFWLTNGGGPIGNPKSIAMPTSWQSSTLGSASDVWGASLTPATINSGGFGVQTWMADPPGEICYQVDYISVKVYYATGGQWMAGTYYSDGSWRLANNVTSLNLNTKLLMKANTGYLRIGSGTAPSYPLHMSGGAYCTGTTWTNSSSRSQKLNIAPVPAASAWDLLDLLQPVDFEYRKMETQFKLKDGSVVREQPADPNEVAEEVTVWTDEGSGECHRGFIAEETPAPLTRGDGIAALDIAANNTAALKEAKRRILELEKNGGGLDTRLAATETARADLATEVQQLATGVIRVEDLKPGAENTTAVLEMAAAVLRQLGVDPWVEIALADAIETVPETVESSVAKAVTKYRLNLETAQAEAYTVEETVTEQTPTGKTVKRVKSGVRFDEATGKAYRWVGLSSAGAAETLTALRTAGQIAAVQTNMRLAAKLGAPPSGGHQFVAPPSGGHQFVAPPLGGPEFVAPPSGGQKLVAPPSGGILSASASAATPANSKPAAR